MYLKKVDIINFFDFSRWRANSYFELSVKYSNQCGFRRDSLKGGSKCQIEPVHKNLNPNIIHQLSQQYGSNTQFEQGGREPQFEPDAKNGKVKAVNEKICNNKITIEETTEPTKKYSNHIEFVDYIPTHEVITYRYLFAYGFYVV